MNWEAIEAISSLIGAVGVVITVAYLAYQIRQNTHSIEGATEQSLMSLEQDVYEMTALYASVFRRGMADFNVLSADEATQFSYILSAEMSLVYSAYVQYNRKLISEEVWAAYERGMAEYFENAGFLAAWTALKSSYPVSFVEQMSKLEK